MKTKQAAVVVIVVVIIVALAVFAANKSSGVAGVAAVGRSGPSAEAEVAEAKSVKTVTAALKTLKPYIDASGDVEAAVNVAVYPDIGGKIVEYKVTLGDYVEKGQAIATIDPSKPGSVYALSQALSPIAGTVTSILAQLGETVSSSTSLAKVGIVDDLKVVVKLAERDSAKAAKGMTAKVSFEALPDESFSAYVSRVSPVLDPTSRTREIWLAFSSRNRRISSGMYAKVRLFTAPLVDALVIPAAALVLRNDETFVYVVSDKSGKASAEKRTVKAGTSVDSEVAILDGLSVGDKVVYEGQSGLADAVAVTVVNEAAK